MSWANPSGAVPAVFRAPTKKEYKQLFSGGMHLLTSNEDWTLKDCEFCGIPIMDEQLHTIIVYEPIALSDEVSTHKHASVTLTCMHMKALDIPIGNNGRAAIIGGVLLIGEYAVHFTCYACATLDERAQKLPPSICEQEC